MYDRESLTALLQEAEFERVSERKFLDSVIPVTADVKREEKEMLIYMEGYRIISKVKL